MILTFLFLLAAPHVTIQIDPAKPRQTIDGFGATFTSQVQGGQQTLTPAQRRTAGDLLFRTLRINLGNVDGWVPDRDFAGAPELISGLYPGKITLSWGNPRLRALRDADYERFLDEVAGMMVGWVKRWEQTWGFPPRYVMPFNEPTWGNKELARPRGPAADREMADILKRGGKRLREAGYKDILFVFPNQETIDSSRTTAENVLQDAEARQYIGRIGYHEYPYGSEMTSIRRVLERADRGEHGTVESRTALRALAEKYHLPLWMSEVARPEWDYKEDGLDARDFRLVRGRANHIQSEFLIARASAFFGMNAMWNRTAHEAHYKNRPMGDMYAVEGDNLVLFDQKFDSWFPTGLAYAVGHYSRWITPGETVVLESASSDPLVAVTGFRDNAKHRYVAVVVNNDTRPHRIDIKVGQDSWPARGRGAAEQSTETAYWQPIRITGAIELPARSVTTLTEGEPVRGSAPRVRARVKGAILEGSVTGRSRGIAWIQVSGPGRATIDTPASLRTTVSNLQAGEYVFRLFAVGEDWRAGSTVVRLRR